MEMYEKQEKRSMENSDRRWDRKKEGIVTWKWLLGGGGGEV
jgi:ribosomal protein L44E